MDAFHTRAFDIDEMFETMVARVRAIPVFANSWLIYAGERNTGHVSGRHGALLTSGTYGNKTYSLCEKPDRNYGVWTTAERKKLFAEHMRKSLEHDMILITQDFVVFNKNQEPLGSYRDSMVLTLCDQLRQIVPDGKGGWTGKYDSQGKRAPGQVDDLAMAMMMGVYYLKMFLARKLSFVDYTVFETTSIVNRGDFSLWD
jgi:hypothetical protein